MTGQIIRLMNGQGFGFIKGEDEQEYFFHYSSLENTVFDSLREGNRVNFAPKQTAKGLRAESVRLMI